MLTVSIVVETWRGSDKNHSLGENFELRAELNSEYRDRRADAIKRVIANMTVGKDVSGLFPDVLKNMVSSFKSPNQVSCLTGVWHMFCSKRTIWSRKRYARSKAGLR